MLSSSICFNVLIFLLHFGVGKSRIYQHDHITNVTENLFPVPVKVERIWKSETFGFGIIFQWERTLSYYSTLDNIYIELYWRAKFFIYTVHSLFSPISKLISKGEILQMTSFNSSLLLKAAVHSFPLPVTQPHLFCTPASMFIQPAQAP